MLQHLLWRPFGQLQYDEPGIWDAQHWLAHDFPFDLIGRTSGGNDSNAYPHVYIFPVKNGALSKRHDNRCVYVSLVIL